MEASRLDHRPAAVAQARQDHPSKATRRKDPGAARRADLPPQDRRQGLPRYPIPVVTELDLITMVPCPVVLRRADTDPARAVGMAPVPVAIAAVRGPTVTGRVLEAMVHRPVDTDQVLVATADPRAVMGQVLVATANRRAAMDQVPAAMVHLVAVTAPALVAPVLKGADMAPDQGTKIPVQKAATAPALTTVRAVLTR